MTQNLKVSYVLMSLSFKVEKKVKIAKKKRDDDLQPVSEPFVCKIFSSNGNFDLATYVFTAHVHSIFFLVRFRLVMMMMMMKNVNL